MVLYNANFVGGNSLTVTGCTAGVLYKFQIATINAISISTLSSMLQIIAASVPDPPTSLTINNSLTNDI